MEGVKDLQGLYTLLMGEEGSSADQPKQKGILTYKKDQLKPGMVIAVYDGTLKADQTVDGDVGYFKITESLDGDKYAFEGADFEDVIDLPDLIPLPDDGSYTDFRYTITADQLMFEDLLSKEAGLDASSKVNEGDFVYFYKGTPSSLKELGEYGLGRIVKVSKTREDLVVFYEYATLEEFYSSSGMYVKLKDLDIPLTEDEKEIILKGCLINYYRG